MQNEFCSCSESQMTIMNSESCVSDLKYNDHVIHNRLNSWLGRVLSRVGDGLGAAGLGMGGGGGTIMA
jgi:hypothetical protein